LLPDRVEWAYDGLVVSEDWWKPIRFTTDLWKKWESGNVLDGFATRMRGKSATCRRHSFLRIRSMTVKKISGSKTPNKKTESRPASHLWSVVRSQELFE